MSILPIIPFSTLSKNKKHFNNLGRIGLHGYQSFTIPKDLHCIIYVFSHDFEIKKFLNDSYFQKNFVRNKNIYWLIDQSSELPIIPYKTYDDFVNPPVICDMMRNLYRTDYVKNYNFIEYFHLDTLASSVLLFLKQKKQDYVYKKLENLTKKKFCSKKATFYNGKINPARIIALNYFSKHNLIEDCFYTFNDISIDISIDKLKDIFPVDKIKDQYSFNSLPEYLFETENLLKFQQTTKNKNFTQFICDTDHIFNSHLHIVIETDCQRFKKDQNNFCHKNWVFLTEKTYKALMSLQPFIIYGNKGSIQTLRNMGFDVFDDIIDHSYDKLNESGEKLMLFLKEANRLINLDHSDWLDFGATNFNRLYHNYNHFIKTSNAEFSQSQNKLLEFLQKTVV